MDHFADHTVFIKFQGKAFGRHGVHGLHHLIITGSDRGQFAVDRHSNGVTAGHIHFTGTGLADRIVFPIHIPVNIHRLSECSGINRLDTLIRSLDHSNQVIHMDTACNAAGNTLHGNIPNAYILG